MLCTKFGEDTSTKCLLVVIWDFSFMNFGWTICLVTSSVALKRRIVTWQVWRMKPHITRWNTWFVITHLARYFADDIFKLIFLNEMVLIVCKSSLRAVDNKSELVQILACRQTGDKSLSESMTTWFTDAYMRYSALMSQRCTMAVMCMDGVTSWLRREWQKRILTSYMGPVPMLGLKLKHISKRGPWDLLDIIVHSLWNISKSHILLIRVW